MTDNAQLAWATFDYYLLKIQEEGNDVGHFVSTVKRLKQQKLNVGTIENITLLLRNAYGVGAKKSF